jgi:hypothetical protein
MNKTIRQVLFTAIPILLLLAACAPAPAPTADPNLINSQIATSVALTVASQNLDTAQAQPTITSSPIPTDTPAPSPTPEFVEVTLPTDTPITNIVSPTSQPASNDTPGPTSTPALYACDAYAQSPNYQEQMDPGESFDIRWVIVNTGTRPWPRGFDVKYVNGAQMTGPKVVEIPVEMNPNDTYTILLDATAPNKEGLQYMTWMVEGQLCFPSVSINVVD